MNGFWFATALGLSTCPSASAADTPIAAAPAPAESVRGDAEFLAEIKRSAEPQNLDGKVFDEYMKTVSDQAENVLNLLERMTAAYPNSTLLADARFEALAPATRAFHLQPSRWSKRLRGLAEAVAADAGKRPGDRGAAADLVLLELECDQWLGSRFVIHRMDEAERSATWKKSGPVVARIETYLEKHPAYAPAAAYLAQLDRSFRLFGKEAEAARTEIMRRVGDAQPRSKQAYLLKLLKLVGKPLDFSFTPVGTEKPLAMKDLRGKVVVLDFWATWCRACVYELDGMKKMYERCRDRGAEFIGIGLDEEISPLQDLVEEKKIPWPQAVGAAVRKRSDEWGIFELPTYFVVDKKGVVRSVERHENLETLIEELLAE